MMIDPLKSAVRRASAGAFELLLQRDEKVSFAESLTGGMIASALIENSGASAVIDESYVTYAPQSKMRILGVCAETVNVQGVVSARCAMEMAAGVRRISKADWGVSATGQAGPDGGSDAIPVGTVFIGISGKNGTRAVECHFGGSRDDVRACAVHAALRFLKMEMEK